MPPTECFSCLSISGDRRISPGRTIHRGEHWFVEHAFPTSLPGWLVIVAARHVEALHDLTPEERAELSSLQYETVDALRATLGCKKEYLACFAEKEGFAHIHFHVVPRRDDLPDQLKGSRSFAFLEEGPDNISPEAAIEVCDQLARFFEARRS